MAITIITNDDLLENNITIEVLLIERDDILTPSHSINRFIVSRMSVDGQDAVVC